MRKLAGLEGWMGGRDRWDGRMGGMGARGNKRMETNADVCTIGKGKGRWSVGMPGTICRGKHTKGGMRGTKRNK